VNPDQLHAYYDKSRDWRHLQADRLARLALLPTPEASVLDVGCGYGDLYPLLRKAGNFGEYLGVDLHAPHIESAQREFPQARWVVNDVLAWTPPIRFDWVLTATLFSGEGWGDRLGDMITALDRMLSWATVGLGIVSNVHHTLIAPWLVERLDQGHSLHALPGASHVDQRRDLCVWIEK